MFTLDEAVAKILSTHPFPETRFFGFARDLPKRNELRPYLSRNSEDAYREAFSSLERVLATAEWRNRVTARFYLTSTPCKAGSDSHGNNDPAFHAALLTGLVYLGMLRIADRTEQNLAWTNLLEQLRSFPLIRGAFPTATDEQINRCLVALHREGAIVFERIIQVPQQELAELD